MARITVIGGTGYAGSNIAREAAARGNEVTVIARKEPEQKIEGVAYVTGDVTDAGLLADAVANSDVVVEALSPRGSLEGNLRGVVAGLADEVKRAGKRLGVVGGAGSLLVEEDGPTLSSTPGFPEAAKAEAGEMADILGDLRASDESLDWFYLSPAANFGGFNPGRHTGQFRIGGDVLMSDAAGTSDISGADFAQAFVDEIEKPAHRRERFSVAY